MSCPNRSGPKRPDRFDAGVVAGLIDVIGPTQEMRDRQGQP